MVSVQHNERRHAAQMWLLSRLAAGWCLVKSDTADGFTLNEVTQYLGSLSCVQIVQKHGERKRQSQMAMSHLQMRMSLVTLTKTVGAKNWPPLGC